MHTYFEFERFELERLVRLLDTNKEFLYMDSFSKDHDWENEKIDILHIKETFAKYARFHFLFIKENGDKISFNVKQAGTEIITSVRRSVLKMKGLGSAKALPLSR